MANLPAKTDKLREAISITDKLREAISKTDKLREAISRIEPRFTEMTETTVVDTRSDGTEVVTRHERVYAVGNKGRFEHKRSTIQRRKQGV